MPWWIVAEPDKCFGQVGNDPFCAAIKTRRNALNERSDLCDLHMTPKSPQTKDQTIEECSGRQGRLGGAGVDNRGRLDVGLTPDQDAVIFQAERGRVCSILTVFLEPESQAFGTQRRSRREPQDAQLKLAGTKHRR